MKKLLVLIWALLFCVGTAFAQIDVDVDDNNDIDEAYGGTNVSALNLITSELTGSIHIVNVSSNCTIGTDCDSTSTKVVYGGLMFVTGARTITLPAVSAGMSACFYSISASAIIIDPNASDGIKLSGATRGTDGYYITNSSAAAGDYVCIVADSAAGWTTLGMNGTWAQQTE